MGQDQDGEEVTIIIEDSIISSSSQPQSTNGNLRLQHLSVATGLILTYFTEIGVQVFLTIYCYRSVLNQKLDWPLILGISLGVSSLLVSIVSIVWVWRGLDFAGRLCGRFLCYVLHFFLLGLVWRYLKLAFAYDHADVQEFLALRIFQAYIQSLPLISIHLAWLITTHRENWTNLTIYLVAIEAVSVVTALILASYMKASPDTSATHLPPNYPTTERFLDNLMCSTKKAVEEEESVMWCQVLSVELNILSRGLLLSARLLVIGILLAHLRFWAGVLIFAHFLVTVIWLSIREKSTGIPDETLADVLKRSFETSYILFWEATSTLTGGLRLSTRALPALLLIVENVGLVLVHWYWVHGELLLTITTGTCLLVGTLLFVSLNLLSDSRLGEMFRTGSQTQMELASPGSQKGIASKRAPDHSDELEKVLYQNMSDEGSPSESGLIKEPRWHMDLIGEMLEKSNSSVTDKYYTNIREIPNKDGNMSGGGSKRPRVEKTSPQLLGPRGPTPSWVPDTCCNDSNGSSNSRNTNTLPGESSRTDLPGVPDNLIGTHFVFCYPQRGHFHVYDHSRLNNQVCRPEKIPTRSRLSPSVKLRTSSPVEIKSASRVIMNHNPNPRHSRVRESKYRRPSPPLQPDPKKLLEDSYGILICEGDTAHPDRLKSNHNFPSIFHVNKRLRVLCAKCFQNHDPLLTDCLVDVDDLNDSDTVKVTNGMHPLPLPSETTEYPSETEMTWRAQAADQLSVVSSCNNSSDDTTWACKHVPIQDYSPAMCSTTMIPSGSDFPKQFTSREYVRTWLLSNQARIQQFNHYDEQRTNVKKSIGMTGTRRANSDSYQKTSHKGNNHTMRVNKVKVLTEAPTRSVSEDDEGCEVSPRTLAQSVIPYKLDTCPVLARALAQQTIYENGLTEETLQMFYKDLEIIV